MGTTLDAIKTDPGVRLGITVQIEGFPYILCDAQDSTHAASALAAYAAADTAVSYTGAIRGMQVDWSNLREEVNPWSADFNPTSVRILVDDGPDDTLGKLIHRFGAGEEWSLNEDLDTTETVITTVKNSATGLTADDIIYAGAEAMKYASDSGTDITVSARGVYAPFKANTETYQRFARVHKLPLVDFDVAFRTKITSQIREWVGRYVAVRLHRIVGSTWDTFDQAHLAFAGTVQDIQDTASARTVITCEDIRGKLNNTVVFQKQWKGHIQAGLYMPAGWEFDFEFYDVSSPASSSATGSSGETLSVVSGTPGTNEIAQGYYTSPVSALAFNNWINGLSTYTGPEPEFSVNADGYFQIRVDTGMAEGDTFNFVAPVEWFGYFGFEQAQPISYSPISQDNRYFVRGVANSSGLAVVTASQRPFRAVAFQHRVGWYPPKILINHSVGDWISQGSLLPEPIRTRYNTTSGDWGLVRVLNNVFLVKRASATEFSAAYNDWDLVEILGTSSVSTRLEKQAQQGQIVGIREGDADTTLYAEQVLFIEDDFKQVIASLFASTDGSGYNHATYDNLNGVGAAIPWELLGAAFEESIEDVANLTTGGKLAMYIDRPTLITALIGPELLLRRSTLVFAEGGYRLVAIASPADDYDATVTLDESNKGAPRSAEGDAQRTTTELTARWLRNTVKVEYNRGVDEKYRDSITIVNQASINDHGETRPVTIKAPNTFGGAGVLDTISALAAGIAAHLLPTFGQPVHIYRRTINHRMFYLTPGTLVYVTDDYARDPATGLRGITSKSGIILSVTHNWGGEGQDPTGEVEIMFKGFEDRVRSHSPAADVDESETNAGYDAANRYLYLHANKWTDAGEGKDINFFSVGDEVTIIETDWTAGATPDSWTRTISAVDAVNDRITIDSALSSPSWNSAKTYRVFSRAFSAATTTQRNKTYLADDADGEIVNTRQAYEYGNYAKKPDIVFSLANLFAKTQRPERMSNATYYSDGSPLTPAQLMNVARYANNGNGYKYAQQFAFMTANDASGLSAGWITVAVIPLFIGAHYGQTRNIVIAPFASKSVDDMTLRITVADRIPRLSNLNLGSASATDFTGTNYESKDWTVTNTGTPSLLAEQTFRGHRVNHRGQCFVFVELGEVGTGVINFQGFGTAYVTAG